MASEVICKREHKNPEGGLLVIEVYDVFTRWPQARLKLIKFGYNKTGTAQVILLRISHKSLKKYIKVGTFET